MPLIPKGLSTPAAMLKQHCRILQVERFFGNSVEHVQFLATKSTSEQQVVIEEAGVDDFVESSMLNIHVSFVSLVLTLKLIYYVCKYCCDIEILESLALMSFRSASERPK